MNDASPMSQTAYDELVTEVEKLETEDRAALAARILSAREDGDLSENAEYHAAKNDQAFLETKILQLRDQLQNAEIVEPCAGSDEVGFGSTVKVLSTATGKKAQYTIVSSYDQDISAGKLSAASPVAGALMGAKVGAKVTASLPNGKSVDFEVLEIA